MNRYQFIEQERSSYAVERLCRVVGVGLARYYAWRKQVARPPATRVAAAWEVVLEQVFARHKQRDGTRRLRGSSSYWG